MGAQIWGPSDLVCESCNQTEFLLRTVEFSDGERFKVCDRCAAIAGQLGMSVLA